MRGVLLRATCEKFFFELGFDHSRTVCENQKINKESESCNAALYDESFLIYMAHHCDCTKILARICSVQMWKNEGLTPSPLYISYDKKPLRSI